MLGLKLNHVSKRGHRAIVFDIPLTHYTPEYRLATKTMKLTWNPDRINQYKESLRGLTCTEKFQQMLYFTEADAQSEHAVNSAVNIFIEGIRSVADPLFLKTKLIGGTKDNLNRNNSKPPWADEGWVSAKQKFNIWSRKFHKNPSDNNKYNMLEVRKHFKTSSWKCRRRYDKLKTTELMGARVNNARA